MDERRVELAKAAMNGDRMAAEKLLAELGRVRRPEEEEFAEIFENFVRLLVKWKDGSPTKVMFALAKVVERTRDLGSMPDWVKSFDGNQLGYVVGALSSLLRGPLNPAADWASPSDFVVPPPDEATTQPETNDDDDIPRPSRGEFYGLGGYA